MSLRLLPRALRPILRTCTPRAATPLFRALAPRSFTPLQPRLHSTTALTPPATPADPAERPPAYQLWFTCRPCKTRSSHEISKQAYHFGSVLVKCPQCEGRHVIADHLKIFGETARSLEDILADAGWGETIRLETLAPRLKGLVCDDGSVQIVGGEPVEAPLAREVGDAEKVQRE